MTVASEAPSLISFCRPFVELVCEARMQLDRGEGEFASLGAERLLARIEAEIVAMRNRRAASPQIHGLLAEEDRMFADLRTFATWILASGSSDASRGINVVRQQRDPLGDAVFMDHVRDEIAQRKPRSAERLVVYAVCLGLGYTGEEVDARSIKRLRTEIWSQIQRLVPMPRRAHPRASECSPLFYDAYDIRTEKLDGPSVPWWMLYVACTVALVAISIALVQLRGVRRDVADAEQRIRHAAEASLRSAASEPSAGPPVEAP